MRSHAFRGIIESKVRVGLVTARSRIRHVKLEFCIEICPAGSLAEFGVGICSETGTESLVEGGYLVSTTVTSTHAPPLLPERLDLRHSVFAVVMFPPGPA